jgi:transcriptional regulator of acetoin/glycerol metabolism
MSHSVNAQFGVVALPEHIEQGRRMFFEEGMLPRGLVPDPVLRSWQRCTDVGYKIDESMSFNPVQRSAVDTLRARNRDLILAADPEFQRLVRVFGGDGYGILLTDADGFAVAVDGPVDRCGDLLRRALRPGVNLSEDSIGTNAMAAAMLEGQAVGIFGNEHYFSQNGSFQCVAAPIFGVNGELRGAIDVTRDTPLPPFGILSLMLDSAAAIEASLFRTVRATLKVGLRWRDAASDPHALAMLAFGPDGEVVAASRSARRFLDLRGETSGLHHDDLFQGRFEQLLMALRRHSTMEWRLHSGLSVYIGELDRETTPARPVAVPARVPPPPVALPEFGDAEVHRALRRGVRAVEAGLPVLIQGESGTGKEIAAQALHTHSCLRNGPFVALNCGAIPRDLIEGELFGYADGAFTGARRGGAKGRLEEAHGGTLFLDEIGDMPLELQTRLLRVLETRTVTRLGEGSARKLEFQLISATHQPLEQMVEERRFRADLLFRLNGMRLSLPPLRARDGLSALIDVLLQDEGLDHDSLTERCRQALAGFDWPGNCRQLRSSLRFARVMAEPGEAIDLHHLPEDLQTKQTPAISSGQRLGALRELNQDLLAATLREVDGNVSAAAQRLGVNRSTIHRWQKKTR